MFSASKPIRPLRSGFFLAAWGLVVFGSFVLFWRLLGDGPEEGQIELACAKAKLEAMWHVPLPADLEVVGSIRGSKVASADWDLKELGCSDTIYPTATLQLRQ
jgi:hypothetical protein